MDIDFIKQRHHRATRDPMYLFDGIRSVPVSFAICYSLPLIWSGQSGTITNWIVAILMVLFIGQCCGVLVWGLYDRLKEREGNVGHRIVIEGSVASYIVIRATRTEMRRVVAHGRDLSVDRLCFRTWISDLQGALFDLSFGVTLFLQLGFGVSSVFLSTISLTVLGVVGLSILSSRRRYIIDRHELMIEHRSIVFTTRSTRVQLFGASIEIDFSAGTVAIVCHDDHTVSIPLREIVNCHFFAGALLAAAAGDGVIGLRMISQDCSDAGNSVVIWDSH